MTTDPAPFPLNEGEVWWCERLEMHLEIISFEPEGMVRVRRTSKLAGARVEDREVAIRDLRRSLQNEGKWQLIQKSEKAPAAAPVPSRKPATFTDIKSGRITTPKEKVMAESNGKGGPKPFTKKQEKALNLFTKEGATIDSVAVGMGVSQARANHVITGLRARLAEEFIRRETLVAAYRRASGIDLDRKMVAKAPAKKLAAKKAAAKRTALKTSEKTAGA